jgi:hypothetical protein
VPLISLNLLINPKEFKVNFFSYEPPLDKVYEVMVGPILWIKNFSESLQTLEPKLCPLVDLAKKSSFESVYEQVQYEEIEL